MSKEEFLKTQTCVLKVNIHCEGCKAKVKKVLHKIEGVYTTTIDSELGKVTVSGNVEPAKLIKKLNKKGKFAEIWGVTKNGGNNQNQVNNQMKNVQIGNGKGGNNSKNQPLKGSANAQPKGGVPQGQNPQMKALQDLKNQMKVAANDKDQKSVKLSLQSEEGLSDDDDFETDVEFDDYDDEEDEFEDEIDAPQAKKMIPVIGNAQQVPNAMMKNMLNVQQQQQGMKNGGNNVANSKKPGAAGGNNVPIQFNPGDGKLNINDSGKKGGGGGSNGNSNNGAAHNRGGGGKGGKNSSGHQAQDIKNGGGNDGNPNKNIVSHGGAGGGGPQNATNFIGNGSKKGMMMNDGHHGMPNMNAGMGPTSHMPMAHPHMAQMGNPNPYLSGYMQPGSADQMTGIPLNQQQQQYAAMMMNMQRASGNERFQPMVYARPPPAVSYMPPSYPYYPSSSSGDRGDEYAIFSDENTESCSVM